MGICWIIYMLIFKRRSSFASEVEVSNSSNTYELKWNLENQMRSGMFTMVWLQTILGFPCGSTGKESTCNMGDLGSTPGLARSLREGKGYLLRYSDLENSMDWIVHGVTKSQIWLSDFQFHFRESRCLGKFYVIAIISVILCYSMYKISRRLNVKRHLCKDVAAL